MPDVRRRTCQVVELRDNRRGLARNICLSVGALSSERFARAVPARRIGLLHRNCLAVLDPVGRILCHLRDAREQRAFHATRVSKRALPGPIGSDFGTILVLQTSRTDRHIGRGVLDCCSNSDPGSCRIRGLVGGWSCHPGHHAAGDRLYGHLAIHGTAIPVRHSWPAWRCQRLSLCRNRKPSPALPRPWAVLCVDACLWRRFGVQHGRSCHQCDGDAASGNCAFAGARMDVRPGHDIGPCSSDGRRSGHHVRRRNGRLVCAGLRGCDREQLPGAAGFTIISIVGARGGISPSRSGAACRVRRSHLRSTSPAVSPHTASGFARIPP